MDAVTLAAANAATRRLVKRPRTMVWFGDSITYGGGRVTAQPNYAPGGYWVWAQNFLGHPFVTLSNAGVQGDRTDQMLARIQTDVLSYQPGWCALLAGSNDVSNAVPVATIKANLTTIWNTLSNAGISVVAATIPPHTTYTGTMKADTETLNAWIRSQARTRKDLILVDFHAVLTNPANGQYVAGYTPDGIHPSAIGSALMGRAFADAVGPFVPHASPLLPAAESSGSNLLSYGRTVAGGAGSIPTGWTESWTGGPVTYSKSIRTDGIPGSWQNLQLPVGCHGTYNNPNAVFGSAASVGDLLVGLIEYDVTDLDPTATNQTRGMDFQLAILNGSAATIATTHDGVWTYGSNDNMPDWSRSGVFCTPPLAVPSGGVQGALTLSLAGGGLYSFDRAAIVNLTTLGLTA